MKFEIKTDLDIKTQNEIARIEAISSAFRTASETAFLAALAPYLTNDIISFDVDGLILQASGLTVPTSYPGFAKGATFIKTDATGKGVYENTGTSTSAIWDLMGAITSADIEDKAVTDSKLADVLSFEGKTVSLGDVTPVNGAYATGTLTTDGTEVADGTLVVVGDVTYKITATLAAAYDVLIGINAATTLANLVKAINASGTAGVEYFAGTLINPLVSAGVVANSASIMLAKVRGVAGNTINKMSNDAHLDWDGITSYFTAGVDGTVGVKNQIVANATNLYLCIAANTIAGANWRKLVLQSL